MESTIAEPKHETAYKGRITEVVEIFARNTDASNSKWSSGFRFRLAGVEDELTLLNRDHEQEHLLLLVKVGFDVEVTTIRDDGNGKLYAAAITVLGGEGNDIRELPSNLSQQWRGNVARHEVPWVTDGHSMLSTSAKVLTVYGKAILPKLEAGHGLVPAKVIKARLKDAKGATKPAKVIGWWSTLGQFEDPENPFLDDDERKRLLDTPPQAYVVAEDGTFVAMDAHKYKLVQDAIAPDAVKVSDPHSMIVFYKGAKVAALVMPIRDMSANAG